MSAALEPGLRVRCIKRGGWNRVPEGGPIAGPQCGTYWTIESVETTEHGDFLRLAEWTADRFQIFAAAAFEPEGERGLEALRAALRKLPAQAPEHAI